jgi:hypothetical protein
MVVFTDVLLLSNRGPCGFDIMAGVPLVVRFFYSNPAGARSFAVHFTLYNHFGASVATFSFNLAGFVLNDAAEHGYVDCTIPRVPFTPSQYRMAAAIYANGEIADHIPNILSLNIVGSTFFESSRTPDPSFAAVMIDHSWSHEAGMARVTGMADVGR